MCIATLLNALECFTTEKSKFLWETHLSLTFVAQLYSINVVAPNLQRWAKGKLIQIRVQTQVQLVPFQTITALIHSS